MKGERRNLLLATGFVSDNSGEGTRFPSAGGNSADPRVQAVYWRCIAVFFTSARIANPDLRLALFSNVSPPVVAGVDIGKVLERLGVEVRHVALSRRLPAKRTQSWGNVLYFLDIADALRSESDDLAFILMDSDVVVTKPIDALATLLRGVDFVGYKVATAPDDDINGMTRRQMAEMVRETFAHAPGRPVDHYGGELFGCTVETWRRHGNAFQLLFEQARSGNGLARRMTTEEHLFSVGFAGLDVAVGNANHLLKRIWTSPRYSNVEPGDENYAFWHLPAEKRFGLADLFHDLKHRNFDPSMSAQAFTALAAARCGLPRKHAGKIVRDAARRLAFKMRVSL